MKTRSLTIALLASSAGATALAQDSVPFPMASLSPGSVPELLEFELDTGTLGALVALRSVHLTDVPMPAGHTAVLDLQRLDFDPARDVGVYVNGAPSTFDVGDLTLWKGDVVGAAGSHVFLALSSHGTYGWIHDGVELTHVSSSADANGDWSRARGRLYSNAALESAGPEKAPAECAFDDLTGLAKSVRTPEQPPRYGAAPVLELKMSVETDYQLFQVWGNLAAEETYVMALLGALSDRLLSQADIKVTYPYVQFWNKAADPWTSQDAGGGCFDVLDEFRNAWLGDIPNGGHLAHFISGASLGCGVAYLDVICNQDFGFAVSCCINGGVTFPVTQGSNTWDFFVFAHEVGHNLGSVHTHDYCPPLDECASNCNGVINHTNVGTNLSYCHGCPGGMTNITTMYHPTVVGVMRTAAEASCMPLYDPSTVQVFFDDFESGTLVSNGWTKTKTRRKANAAHEGSFGANIRKDGMLERTVDTTGRTDIVVSYWRKTKNYDAGEELRFRYSTNGGGSWTTLEQTSVTSWGYVEHALPASANNNASFMIRFESFGGDTRKENSRIDQVEVLGQ